MNSLIKQAIERYARKVSPITRLLRFGEAENGAGTCYTAVMKRSLMEILACPVCKGNLELTAEKEEGPEVITGSLYCTRCHVSYPIREGIPNLLPPDQR